MGLMDYIKTQLIDIIEWTDDSRDTISWRFPDDDKEIKNGAQLIVRESGGQVGFPWCDHPLGAPLTAEPTSPVIAARSAETLGLLERIPA